MIAGIYAIPILIERLGVERFGLLSLIWLLVGYFSIFDLGLSRALTKILAEYSGKFRDAEMPALFWTAMWLMLGLGLIAGMLLWWLAPSLVSTLNVSPKYFEETLLAFRYAAFGFPIIMLMAGLRGALEAFHEFKTLNLIRIPIGVLNFLIPIPVLMVHDNLSAVVLVTVGTRCACITLYYLSLRRRNKGLLTFTKLQKTEAKSLFAFGGWMTVSNVVGPLMTYIDGFIISAVISASAVALYTVPYDLATKLWIIPGALVAALFPLLAQKIFLELEVAKDIFFDVAYLLLIVVFPLVVAFIALSEIGLEVWLGEEISMQSAPILKILLLGVFINSFALLPFTLLQSAGYPKVTAIIHVAEFPIYILAMLFLLGEFGILGGAIAWLGRILVDFMLLVFVCARYFPSFIQQWLEIGKWLAIAFVVCLAFALTDGSSLKLYTLVVTVFFSAALSLIWLRSRIKIDSSLALHWVRPRSSKE